LAVPVTVVAPPDAPEEQGAAKVGDRRRRLLTVIDGLGAGLVVGVVLGLAVGLLVGVIAGIIVAVALSFAIARGATAVVLGVLGAQPVDEDEFPGVHNIVEGLCATFGLRVPRLMVIEDTIPNSCVLGSGSSAVLVVTTGLVDGLGLIEMEGVMAHELAHLKRHDGAVSSVALTALLPLVWLTGSDRLVHTAVGRGREYLADQIAVATVRYPPGLRDALDVLQHGPEPGVGSVFTGRRMALTRWLWVDPMVGRRDAPLVGELDATPVRIAALAEW
jgi:Zn-dependent protease with chaperone function